MTREEAIFELRHHRVSLEKVVCAKDFTDAIEMAIEALSAEPCEDAISRAWIKKAIHNLYQYSRHTPTEEDIQEYIVDDAPSVAPKQKMGRWLKVDDEEPIAYDCSECGAMVSRRCRFCPDCGTKMSNIPTGSNCTDCILDGTDACTRGAGRAVDGRACEDFVGESED